MVILAFIFGLLLVVAFGAFGYHTARRNGHGMAYAALMMGIWASALSWSLGVFG